MNKDRRITQRESWIRYNPYKIKRRRSPTPSLLKLGKGTFGLLGEGGFFLGLRGGNIRGELDNAYYFLTFVMNFFRPLSFANFTFPIRFDRKQ